MKTIAKGTIKRIHVNNIKIKQSERDMEDRACLTVQTSKGPIDGHVVRILGPSEVVQSLWKPLSSGARIWIETTAELEIE